MPGAARESDIAIRVAAVGDAAAISELVWRLTQQYVLPEQPEGAAAILGHWMSPASIAARIAQHHRHHVAVQGERIVGVVAMRDGAHLNLLFVDTDFQHRGIARALWQVALDACVAAERVERVTVNASSCAVPAYRKLGFVDLGPAEVRDGLLSTPMAFPISAAD